MKELELYKKAKETYYNGSPIMGDVEFDELEKELGLENESYIGVGSTPNYTIKHPYIMGSLSKVQIKYDDGTNYINWFKHADAVYKFLDKSLCDNKLVPCIATPKYDGCSFEYHWSIDKNTYNIKEDVSSRGDGGYGKDLSSHLSKHIHGIWNKIYEASNKQIDEFTLRGEVLINKVIFTTKYIEFTNPRSFVAGILNRKYDDIMDKSILDDLSIIIYDFRTCINGEWTDYDWLELKGIINDELLPNFYKTFEFDGANALSKLYHDFDEYRSTYKFTLDGIVIKPISAYRELNIDKIRPSDCVAIKFLPTIHETTVTNIEWQLGKTGEYTPVIVFDEIILDGKKVNKASGHNYGNLIKEGLGIGAQVSISLAGDIIPFIYKVLKQGQKNDELYLPEGSYVNGCHLMKKLNAVEKMEIDFIASCKTLNINGLGESIAQKIFNHLEYKVNHIFFVDDEKIYKALYSGEGKTAENIINSITKAKQEKTLADVIMSMNLPDCGEKCAEQCARYLINQNYADFSGLSKEGWSWVVDSSLPFDTSDEAHKRLYNLCSLLRHKDNSSEGKEFDKYIDLYKPKDESKIKIILTGSPTKHSNKKAFLESHPEYEQTSKWKECQILFTDSLDSTSSKMEKAKKLGIKIELY